MHWMVWVVPTYLTLSLLFAVGLGQIIGKVCGRG